MWNGRNNNQLSPNGISPQHIEPIMVARLWDDIQPAVTIETYRATTYTKTPTAELKKYRTVLVMICSVLYVSVRFQLALAVLSALHIRAVFSLTLFQAQQYGF
jgi:hypothetical protein